MSSKGQESGFTLIELVVVIVIIGILAAAALPRFVDLTGEARKSTAEGVASSLQAGSAMAHSKWLAQGASNDPVVQGQTVSVNLSGWPDNESDSLRYLFRQDPADGGNFEWTVSGTIPTASSWTTVMQTTDSANSWKVQYNPARGVARASSN